MVVNAAVQMIREAEELKQNILKFNSGTSMLQERSLWPSQQQLQKIYQKVLVLDLDYALDKKVEQDLWNVGFKQQIEALQAISKDRKNPLRSEAQAMLAWVLQAAAGFYLCLLHQICTALKLDLPFRRRASLLGWVEGWSPGAVAVSARLPPPAAARYICQHCLVHLGDLARYRQQPRVAYTFYRHALVVSAHSGQPYNQLALLARRRGRRLGALYWHVRAVLVRAPFPPAPANLLRTLQQHASHGARPTPVLPGMRRAAGSTPAAPARLDAHSYVTELMRALYLIHMVESLEFAATLVETLNNALTSLVATDSFESMTLIKMVCVVVWLVHSCTDGQAVAARALSAGEAAAAALAHALAAGLLLALATHAAARARAHPALKVSLQWAALYPQLLEWAPFQARPQLWHALAHTLNSLHGDSSDKYDSVPLPEDEELHGFQPLERSHEALRFANHAAWDTYGRRVPDALGDRPADDASPPSVVSPASLNSDPELEAAVRAHRLVELGKRLADLRPDQFAYTVEGSSVRFSALCHGGEALAQALAAPAAPAASSDGEGDSEEDAPLPPPVVISEADFREKVRDKRVGILKPQGSLERAREERALAGDDHEQDFEECDDGSIGDDRRDARRPRVNIAMAAILRKQEETCKQVKFRTPPPLAEEIDTETSASQSTPRPKATLPRPQKSLANIPVGRKTGGILALKDKSGYPHLVNVAEETTSRPPEKPVYKDPKVIQPPSHGRRDAPPAKWQQSYEPRTSQKNYGLQNVGITYNPNYEATSNTPQNIRLPVVNPKEIDVRSAALQKQSSRSDYQHRSATYASDRSSFLEQLPPRFANQRWSHGQDNTFKESFNADPFGVAPPSWLNPLSPPQRAQSQLSSMTASHISVHPPSSVSAPPPPQMSIAPPPHISMATASQLSSHPPSTMSAGPPSKMSMVPLSHASTANASQMAMAPPPPMSIAPPPRMSMTSPSRMSAPSSSLQESYAQSWWKRNPAYGQQLAASQAQALQQMYSSHLSAAFNLPPYGLIPQLPTAPSSSYARQPPIGQMPTRHVSPPGYGYMNLQYPSLFEAQPQYQQDYSEEAPRYRTPEEQQYEMSAAAVDTFAPGYEGRRPEEAPPRPESPLDLSQPRAPAETEEEDPPAESSGGYSLFSGPDAWQQVTQAQQSGSTYRYSYWEPYCVIDETATVRRSVTRRARIARRERVRAAIGVRAPDPRRPASRYSEFRGHTSPGQEHEASGYRP